MLNNIQAKDLFDFFVICALIALVFYIPRIRYYFTGLFKQQHLSNPKKNKLAVIVPSRNEKGVTVLLDSLAAQTYDHDFFDTFVVVANKDDDAIQKAKFYKNTYSIVVEGQTCKGEALDGSLKMILSHISDFDEKDKYAGFIIVDADNVVDANFVMEMNNALLSNAQIILGKRCVKNYLYDKRYRSWSVNCSALTYTCLDKLGNVFRSKHKMSCTLCGTGIMVTRDVIEKMGGWPYRTMTEDLELTINALLNEWTSFFYEYAITYTEEGITHKDSLERRSRWVLGYAQINFKYRNSVLKKMKSGIKFASPFCKDEHKKGNFWGCFDYLYSFFPLFLYFGVSVVCFLLFLISIVYSFFAHGNFDLTCAKYALYILGILYGVLVIFTGIALFEDRKFFPIGFFEKLLVLLGNPIFMTEYAPYFVKSYITLFFGKKDTSTNKDWVKIDRIEDRT